jgi:hypothetical protein
MQVVIDSGIPIAFGADPVHDLGGGDNTNAVVIDAAGVVVDTVGATGSSFTETAPVPAGGGGRSFVNFVVAPTSAKYTAGRWYRVCSETWDSPSTSTFWFSPPFQVVAAGDVVGF